MNLKNIYRKIAIKKQQFMLNDKAGKGRQSRKAIEEILEEDYDHHYYLQEPEVVATIESYAQRICD
jgi:hypothetical protein